MVANPGNAAKDSLARCAQHALARIAAHKTWYGSVGKSAARVICATEGVAAHGLDHGMAIIASGEAGADADHDGRHIHRRTHVALGQDGVDHDVGLYRLEAHACGVDQDGYDIAAAQQLQCMASILC